MTEIICITETIFITEIICITQTIVIVKVYFNLFNIQVHNGLHSSTGKTSCPLFCQIQ